MAQQEFIEAIDGIDNGVSQYPSDLSPKYRSRTDLSSRVGWLNPAWNENVDSQKVDVSVFTSMNRRNSVQADTMSSRYFQKLLSSRAMSSSADLITTAKHGFPPAISYSTRYQHVVQLIRLEILFYSNSLLHGRLSISHC